jgi:hypothetical protein
MLFPKFRMFNNIDLQFQLIETKKFGYISGASLSGIGVSEFIASDTK